MHLAMSAVTPLRSDLPPARLAEALRPLVGPAGAPFSGEVGEGGFTVERVNGYHNAYFPVARAAVRPAAGGGSEVLVRLRPHRQVVLFLAIWLLFLAAFAGIVLAGMARHPGRSPLPLLLPAGLALLSWHLAAGVFRTESRWTVERLLERIPALRRADGPAPAPAPAGTPSTRGASMSL